MVPSTLLNIFYIWGRLRNSKDHPVPCERRVERLIFALLIIFFPACESQPVSPWEVAALPPVVAPSGAGYRLQTGDTIDVFVIEDSSFNGEFSIRPSGDIIMPKVGRIGLQGLTLAEAEVKIRAELMTSQLKEATVIVDPGTRGETGGGLTVRLSGEIGQTGRVTLKPLGNAPVSAYQAVVDSGGFKMFANKRKSYILRNSMDGMIRINVDFDAIESGKIGDPVLLEGDCIVVPKKLFGL